MDTRARVEVHAGMIEFDELFLVDHEVLQYFLGHVRRQKIPSGLHVVYVVCIHTHKCIDKQ